MILSYLKTAIRNIVKHRMTSAINVLGLTLGLSVALLIYLYVHNELSYDTRHDRGQEIYRVLRKGDLNDVRYRIGVTSGPFAGALKNDFPDVIGESIRVMPADGLVAHGENKFYEDRVYLADANFLEVFSFPLAAGDKETALSDPSGIILTREMSEKYFADQDPIGKTVTLDNRYEFKVTGVFEEPLAKSHLDFDFVASMGYFLNRPWFNDWWNNSLCTYVLISDPKAASNLESNFPAFMTKYFGEDFAISGNRIDLALQPLQDIYFENDVRYDPVAHGDRQTVFIFAAAGVLVLIIACFNFMNLAIARSSRRSREVGVRKVLGADRTKLVFQFMAESFLLTAVAVALGLAVVEVALPFFNSQFDLAVVAAWLDPTFLLLTLGLLVMVTLLSGSYPAFLLSSFRPVLVLKSSGLPIRGNQWLKKILVVFQFGISLLLIVGTLIINRQLSFIQEKDLGFNRDHVILVSLNNGEVYENRDLFKKRLLASPLVRSVTAISGNPGGFHDASSFEIEGKSQSWRLRTVYTDDDYVKTFGLNLIAGRDFSRLHSTDRDAAVLLNESAVRQIGWKPAEAVGRSLRNPMRDRKAKTVIGVLKDYHFSSLKDAIEPLIVSQSEDHRVAAIRVNPGDVRGAIRVVEESWQEVCPSFPIEFRFLDDVLNRMYREEEKQRTIFTMFSVLSILIACLGIFALAAIAAQQRTREIGIRKVLGSSVGKIVVLMSREFVLLVAAANVIAGPLAYFIARQWLGNFAYRTELSASDFLVAGFASIVVALLTVIWQSLRVAYANPVDVLKYE